MILVVTEFVVKKIQSRESTATLLISATKRNYEHYYSVPVLNGEGALETTGAWDLIYV